MMKRFSLILITVLLTCLIVVSYASDYTSLPGVKGPE